MNLRVTAALAAVIILTGCGGGGGSSDPTEMATSPTTATELRSAIRSTATNLASDVRISFGSVVATTDPNVTGIDTEFRNGRVTTTASRRGAPAITLDTDNSYYDSGMLVSTTISPQGRSGRTRHVFDRTSSTATLGLVAIDWNNSDPNDYMAGGYWLHARAGNPLTVEAGAFVDGPELDLSNPPDMPVSGSASYRGTAIGMYAAQYGSDAGSLRGAAEVGEFQGVATLNANFADNTISGCVGCATPTRITGVYFDPSGTAQAFDTTTTYEVQLGQVSIDGTRGTFQGSNVRITGGALPVASSSGTWGGQFSNQLNGGEPRLVAGTLAGEGTTAGGSKTAFIGVFGAGNH